VHNVGTSAVVHALNHITLLAMILAFASAVLSLLLIRQKDFVDRSAHGQGDPEDQPSEEPAVSG
jgi:hypothetical protein